jgi:hypothetical protein
MDLTIKQLILTLKLSWLETHRLVKLRLPLDMLTMISMKIKDDPKKSKLTISSSRFQELYQARLPIYIFGIHSAKKSSMQSQISFSKEQLEAF